MRYWLIKTESNLYSIDNFRRDRITLWDGVRNYQARNYLREMEPGDAILFYHSVVAPTGIAGVARVKREAVPEPAQFDRGSEYFDPKASLDNPRWYSPEIEFVKALPEVLGLDALRAETGLKGMALLQRGSRLSVQPVTAGQFKIVERLMKAAGKSNKGRAKA